MGGRLAIGVPTRRFPSIGFAIGVNPRGAVVSFRRLAMTMLLIAAAVTAALPAQAERESCARHRVESLAPGHPAAQEWYVAVSSLVGCPMTGPATLIELWRGGLSPNGPEMNHVGAISSRLHDGRLFDVVLEIIGNTAAPRGMRQAAVKAAIGYYDWTRWISFTPPAVMDGDSVGRVAVGGTSLPVSRGSVPLPPDAPTRVYQAIRRLASPGEPDRIIRTAAVTLLIHLPEPGTR